MGKTGALAGALCMIALIAAAAGLDDPPPLRRSTLIAVGLGARGPGALQGDEARRLYDDARASCRAGKADEAARLLLAAIRAGFDDVSHLRREGDLRALRDHPIFRAILAARDAADPFLAERRLEAWRSAHDPAAYRYEADAGRHLAYASALQLDAHARMRIEVEALWDHLAASLFAPPRHEILIVLPTPADGAAMLPDSHVHGHYSHRAGRLVAREPGRALRHELVHALHQSHMDALGEEHPAWIQEGLACLYESWEPGDDGSIEYPPNDRDEIVRLLAARSQLLSWEAIMSMSATDLARQAPRAYPQLRSMMRFVAATAGLPAWYAAYVERIDADETGAAALESALGLPLAELERQWLRSLQDGREPDAAPARLH